MGLRLRGDRKVERLEAAGTRNKAWRDLTPQEQIKSLQSRRGASKRQLAKLKALLEKSKP